MTYNLIRYCARILIEYDIKYRLYDEYQTSQPVLGNLPIQVQLAVCSGFVRKSQAAKHIIVTRTNKQQSAKQQLQNIISINMITYFIYPLFFASVQVKK